MARFKKDYKHLQAALNELSDGNNIHRVFDIPDNDSIQQVNIYYNGQRDHYGFYKVTAEIVSLENGNNL